MRRPLTTLTLVVICGLLALLVAGALAVAVAHRARRRSSARQAGASTRSVALTLSAAPGDLALAELSFPAAARRQLTARSLRVVATAPFGDDYMAAAAVAPTATPGVPRALVLLVNRPSPLDDPVDVHLRVTVQRSLGADAVRQFANPFARPGSGSRPALCDLRVNGSALAGSELSVLDSRGGALMGLSAAGAVAEAYDLVCGLSDASTLTLAVERPPSSSPPPGEQPAPSPPSPGGPVGKLPGEGCTPAPGYACPG